MEKLAIITPCSRPDNLYMIYPTVEEGLKYFALTWYVVMDGIRLTSYNFQPFFDIGAGWMKVFTIFDETSVSGNGMRNFALDKVEEDSYVWFLDDDNIVHPDFFRSMAEVVKTYPEVDAWILTQDMGNNKLRVARESMVRATHIDQAQYFLRMDFIRDARFVQDYCADGILIEALKKRGGNFKYIPNKPLVYYNKLR